MRANFPLILSIFLFSACQNAQQPEPVATADSANTQPAAALADTSLSTREAALKAQEAASQQKEPDLGPQLSTIEIGIKATKEERKDYKDGIIPFINLDLVDKEIASLIDPDETVLPYDKVIIMIDYPLAKPIFFDLTSPTKGFTRKQLVLAISKKYHEIYAEEEKTAKTKTIPLKDRKGLENRNQTDGTYGIWGHDLSDLALSEIIVHQNDGSIFLELDIES